MSIVASIPDDSANGDAALKSDGSAGVKSDTLALKRTAIGFMLNATGAIKVKTYRGSTVTLAPATGVPIALEFTQVFSTGTTVNNADIVLFYSTR